MIIPFYASEMYGPLQFITVNTIVRTFYNNSLKVKLI